MWRRASLLIQDFIAAYALRSMIATEMRLSHHCLFFFWYVQILIYIGCAYYFILTAVNYIKGRKLQLPDH